jgi:threonine dehydrogenase-like Zn-dependent dehydrogenase
MEPEPLTRDATRGPIPATQHAIQFVGTGELVHNRAKPVPTPGPHQILARIEACGICFSDTKLLHQFSAHPRKSEVRSGLSSEVLAEIPSYVPGDLPTVPGHEAVCRIVAVGDEVRRHRVGERCLVQTDYRHLPTTLANAAFGYNFEGGLEEYVLLDERMIIDPASGERFLIPVGEEPSASAVALLEPWACVEASYVYAERRALRLNGRLLIVAEPGHDIGGLGPLVEAARPAEIAALLADDARQSSKRAAVESLATPDGAVAWAASIDEVPRERFDDIVYFGADAGRIELLQDCLAPRGLINIVCGGRRIGRPVAVDVGRVHYDLTRWVGTQGDLAADGYAAVPDDGELRPGDRLAVIGAAGPMGLMHVVRAASAGLPGLSIAAVDVDDGRLEHLQSTVAPIVHSRGIELTVVNSRTTELTGGFSYIALMVPAPQLVGQLVGLAADGCRINIFAGFANRTRAEVDLDRYIAHRLYLLGTSGSLISDMKAVLAKLERHELDTNVSLDAVTGFEGVGAALQAVESRSSFGKIVVYPGLPELGLVRLSELRRRFPAVADQLADGTWNRAAEETLLEGARTSSANVDP